VDKLKLELNYLMQNPLMHMDMIVPIKRGTAHIIYAAEDGVCFKETKSGAFMMSVSCKKTGEQLLKLLDKDGLFTFHQDFMLDDFKAKVRYNTIIENYQAVYFGKDLLAANDCIRIKPLDKSHFDIVIENYDVDVGMDYLHKSIKEGRIFGGFADSSLIGFVGIHAEGSIGLLKVFDAYLEKGYGTALAGHITNYQLSQGIVPFAQIGINNNASLSVFAKLGFSISSECVYWMF